MNTPRVQLCLFNRHKPRGNSVVWDGLAYTGTCGRCERAIRRKKRGRWIADPDAAGGTSGTPR